MTEEEIRKATAAGSLTVAVDHRSDNDAFWERKIAEARTAGGIIAIDMSDIPLVPGIVLCLPSARVDTGRMFILEGIGPARRMSDMVPGWQDEPGGQPVIATSRFRLRVSEAVMSACGGHVHIEPVSE